MDTDKTMVVTFGFLMMLLVVSLMLCFVIIAYADHECCTGSRSIADSPGGVITIQPPVGLPSYGYPSSNGSMTIQPPVGLPTLIYPGAMPNSPVTVQPPVGVPTYLYGR